MKLEAIAVTALVAVSAFVLCLTLIGDSILNQQYYTPMPGNYTSQFPKSLELQQQLAEMANKTYAEAARPQTGNLVVDALNQLQAGWQQIVSAFTIGLTVISIPLDVQGSASEVTGFLHINSLIVAAIFVFLVMAVGFSVAAFFRGRRP